MNRSFYNGVSGSLAYQYGMTSIASNIGNINTMAFRGRGTEFANLFSQTMSESKQLPTSNQIGLGARVQATPLDMRKGELKDSDRKFDTAIRGKGWYAIQQPEGIVYTRKGDFYFDAQRYLVDDVGRYPLGVSGNVFKPDPDQQGNYIATLRDTIDITPNAKTEKLFLPKQVTLPAKATRNVSLAGNLNPTPQKRVITSQMDPNDYKSRVDEQTQTVTISGTAESTDEIDRPTEGDNVTVTFTNAIGENISFTTTLDKDLKWKIENADISKLDPSDHGPITTKVKLESRKNVPSEAHFRVGIVTGHGEKGIVKLDIFPFSKQPAEGSKWKVEAKTLEFFEKYNPDKNYDPAKYYIDEISKTVYTILDKQTGELVFDGKGALIGNTLSQLDNAGIPLTLDMGSVYDPNQPNSGYDGFTALANIPTELTKNEADGYEKSEFHEYTITSDGTIFAIFKNGEMTAAARLSIFYFRNEQGLSSTGGVYFTPTLNSGKPYMLLGKDGKVNQDGKILPFRLEGSNVNGYQAMTELIIMQKAFDANAKSITTSDQMIQKAINMKK